MVRRDYAGEQFIRLDSDKLNNDLGFEVAAALVAFLSAHYAFNDSDDPPSEAEKLKLITTMVQARAVLGEINPYLFVDSLCLLEQEVSVGS